MKNRVNKQIIKALSVGLAASMALQPVTVYAEDNVSQENKEDKSAFDTASEKASGSVEAAHDAFVGKTSEETTSSDNAPAAAPVAETTTPADGATSSAEVQNSIKDAKSETEDYEQTVKTAIPNAGEVVGDAISHLDTAESKLEEGGQALNDADQAVKDAQTSNKETENNIKEYNAHMDKAEKILEYGSNPAEGEDHMHQVGQFTDATTGAEKATSDYSGIITDAGKVKADMDEVKASADKYNAEADTDGSQFAAIKKEYDDAKVVLDGLDQRLSDATDKYNAADKNYDDAVDAYTSAKNEYDLALAAYNAIIDTVDKDGNVKDGSETTTSKKIELAKEKLAEAQKALDEAKLTQAEREKLKDSAENEVKDAKTNLDAAKVIVEQKLNEMQRLGLQDIIDTQTVIDGMPEGTAKEAKKVELQQKFIQYYLLTKNKDVTNVQFVGEAQFDQITGLEVAKDLEGNDIVVDGKKYYVSGYNSDGSPILEVIPSALKVTYNVKDTDGNVVKGDDGNPITESDYYSVIVNQDGTFSVVKEGRVAEDADHVIVAGHAAYYTKDGVEATIPDAVEDKTKKTKGDDVLVINKENLLDDIKNGLQDAPETGTRTIFSDDKFEKIDSKTTKIVTTDPNTKVKTTVITETYEKKTVTETTTQGDPTYSYKYDHHDVVTTTEKEEFPCTQEGYEAWLAAIEEHENDKDFKAEYFDYEPVYFLGVPVWIKPAGMKDIKDMTGWDSLSYNFDIIASYLFGSQPFSISYTKVTQESSTENKEGFLETKTDNYAVTKTENVKYYTVKTTTVETPVYKTNTTTETVKENEKQDPVGYYRDTYGESRYSYYDDDPRFTWGPTQKGEQKAENALRYKLSLLNGSYAYNLNEKNESSTENGNVRTVTLTKYRAEYVGEVYQNGDGSWSYWYVFAKVPVVTETKYTTTTTNDIDHYETRTTIKQSDTLSRTNTTNLDPITAVSSIKFYGGDTYKYNGATEDVTKKYYSVSNNNTDWGTSADSTYQEAIRGQQTAHQNLLDAQEAYRRASAAYQNAQDALDKAKADVNALSASMASKGDLLNAQQRLSAAETALGTAAQNKEAAEIALGDALTKKGEAERAVQAAKDAFELTKPSYDKAEADKKAADDARNNQSGGGDDTTGGGDDTTTGGGDGTTTFIPVAVTPATNVVAPAADNAQAPAVLGARTTRRSAAKAAADTDTVATDNSNGNGNGGNDNSAVAGAQKEETKTPEAPKEETKIDDGDVALQATPELEEGSFAWWWLLILAALAGVSVEEYVRRKSNKAKAEAKDSTKINK